MGLQRLVKSPELSTWKTYADSILLRRATVKSIANAEFDEYQTKLAPEAYEHGRCAKLRNYFQRD